jgi:membrane associated rhomboid family serine protease
VLPLKDNIPTARFPIVTVVIIAINLAFFIWQISFPTEPDLDEAGFAAIDQSALEYGAMPYRITHPGESGDCAVGAINAQNEAGVVCPGTADFDRAAQRGQTGESPEPIPIDQAPWWVTLFSSMFMHGGILHIAGNMLFLWVFGNNIEDSMGRVRFLLFYVLAGIAAVYAQSLLEPNSTLPTIGASGAVAGVLGGYILLHPRARVLTMIIIVFFFTFIEIPALIMLGIWFVLQAIPAVGGLAVPDIAGGGGIAYLAHVGGFIFGLATIKLWANRHRAGESTTSPAY